MQDLTTQMNRTTMNNWISREEELPPYSDEVEVSFDGETSEGMGRFVENTQCMMAGIAGGHGYFTDQFATIDDNLVLHDVTHWRYPEE